MRARNIKPGFFKNEDLADGGPYAQLLFEGLWCLADKAGRLEDRPRRIKAEIFPYYEIKPGIESLLNFLSDKEFIVRYQVGKFKLIQISQFLKHQCPHNTEKTSIFPEPLITCDSPVDNESLTVDSRKSNGGNPPDSLIHGFTDLLIPDSLERFATPAPGNGDARPQSPAFSCECFEISPEYLEELTVKFPLLPSEYLIKEFFPRMRDWCLDNRKNSKHLKKFDARGRLKTPRGCFSNWLKKEDPARTEGYTNTSPARDDPPDPFNAPGLLKLDPNCPLCHGDWRNVSEPCSCLHPVEDDDAKPEPKRTAPPATC